MSPPFKGIWRNHYNIEHLMFLHIWHIFNLLNFNSRDFTVARNKIYISYLFSQKAQRFDHCSYIWNFIQTLLSLTLKTAIIIILRFITGNICFSPVLIKFHIVLERQRNFLVLLLVLVSFKKLPLLSSPYVNMIVNHVDIP